MKWNTTKEEEVLVPTEDAEDTEEEEEVLIQEHRSR